MRVVTLGCRLNAYESEVMRAHAAEGLGANTAVVVPSPLVGEGQGGGDCRTFAVGIPPTPNPSPQGGGEPR